MPHTPTPMDLQWYKAKCESRLFFDTKDNPNAPHVFAYLVHCVNQHAALVAALRMALATLERVTTKHGPFSSTRGTMDVLAQAITRAEQEAP